MVRILICSILLVGLPAARGETTAERLLARYQKITSVACEVRRTKRLDDVKETWLTRVYYEHPLRLHTEQVAPIRRRIVCDGTTFFSHVESATKGFSRPVIQLSKAMQRGLALIPGTPSDQLYPLQGKPETNLAPTTAHPVRKGYTLDSAFVVLSLSPNDRLARVDIYHASDMKQRVATCIYSDYKETDAGVAMPCRHQLQLTINGRTMEETTRIVNLAVNTKLAAALFIPSTFFKNIDFVDTLEKNEKPR